MIQGEESLGTVLSSESRQSPGNTWGQYKVTGY